MKRSTEDHAARFDAVAEEYDETQDSEEYLACVESVIEHAATDGVVLDLGAGTGAISLSLAADAEFVHGRDPSSGMREVAKRNAEERGIENVEFAEGTFREPDFDRAVDLVVSNFAMHHLSDEEKREAIETIASLGPRTFVLGDVMLFDPPDPEEPFYDPAVDDPATVGVLADALTDAGFSLSAVERVHSQVGVLVAERADPERASRTGSAQTFPTGETSR